VAVSSRNEFRAWLSAAALAGLAAWSIAAFPAAELVPRAKMLAFTAAARPEQARLSGSALAFDRPYGEFLEAVRRETPDDATIALAIPASEGSYRYAAAYLLAPRRTVLTGRLAEAGYVAGYGVKAKLGTGARPIVHGALARLP
jgi:thiamine pyrophosphate-dependent acetolactate synthase large subunit-like protein